jgi:hypothetical protein
MTLRRDRRLCDDGLLMIIVQGRSPETLAHCGLELKTLLSAEQTRPNDDGHFIDAVVSARLRLIENRSATLWLLVE